MTGSDSETRTWAFRHKEQAAAQAVDLADVLIAELQKKGDESSRDAFLFFLPFSLSLAEGEVCANTEPRCQRFSCHEFGLAALREGARCAWPTR